MTADGLPQHGTRRRAERPTLGTNMHLVASTMGFALKPWQQHAADVMGELVVDDNSGELVCAYSTVSLSVGRRAGKSLLVFLHMLRRMLRERGCRAFVTMQNRGEIAEMFRDEWVPMVEDSPIGHRVKIGLSNGSEYMRLPQSSRLRIFSPTRTAMHGKTADVIAVDESWSLSMELGEDIETGAGPALWTRPGSQLIKHSAAGNADSSYWAGVLEAGREAAVADTGRGHAHLEWTTDGTDLDEDDPRTWRAVHPGGLPMEILQAEFDNDRELFRRQVLNVTAATGSRSIPIDIQTWALQLVERPPARDGLLSVAVDVAIDEETAAVCLAFDDGTVELLDHRPGSDWVRPLLADLCSTRSVHAVTLDAAGPAGVLVAELLAAGIPLSQPPLRVICAAAAGYARAVNTGTSKHVYDPSLDIAVTGARKRRSGDGAWSLSRVSSVGDVVPLIAASLAWHAHPEAHGPAYIGVH